MTASPAEAWFAEHTVEAPEALRQRAEHFFVRADEVDLAERLAGAGRAALVQAVREDGGRAAALDLLAADALITLALLRVAESTPGQLGPAAASLRSRAASTP